MAETKKIIMSWGKCKFEIGDTGENDAFATELIDVGTIKDKTTVLTSNDGDELTMKATGGVTVASEPKEGTLEVETTIIEPTAELYEALGIANPEDADGEQKVQTHIVPGDKSVKITPHNKGARGIKAPCCRIKVSPAMDEENGNSIKITASISKTTAVPPTKNEDGSETDNNYWYSRFKTKEALK